jgi:predicted nuclease of predicted toxin-antitoxin system
MKILIDANISWRLKEALKDFFEICTHVDSCELKVPASDLEIWNFAFENQYTILTKQQSAKEQSCRKIRPFTGIYPTTI